MTDADIQTLVDDATFDFTVGDQASALDKLARATTQAPGAVAAWHALAEINFHLRRFDEALLAAERALAIELAQNVRGVKSVNAHNLTE